MRRLSLLLLACLTLGIAWAERVSVNTAQQVAANVAAGLSPSNLRSSSDLKLVYAAPAKQQSGLRAAGNESDYYIFNVGTGDGFIIVAGEDRVRPVLGYSAEGEVDMEKMPDNMKGWLEMYQKEISWAVAQNISASGEIQGEWQGLLNGTTQLRAEDPQLQTAHWAQGEPFNRLTPEIEGEQAVTGCVATAQAIVMYYYKYPNAPLVSSSENTATVAIYDAVETSPGWYKQVLRSETPWSAPLSDRYDWDDMLFEYDNNVEYGQEGDAVAKLMKDCGINVAMEYSVLIYPDGDKSYSSGASTNLVAASLKNVFGYSQSVQYVEKQAYRWANWTALIKKEIDEKRPVILNGTDPDKGGHAFVCDGYSPENYFHVNWGWGNSFGYYLLSALDDDGDGNGFNEENYGAIIGIQPEGGEPAKIEPFVTEMTYDGDINPLPTDLSVHIAWRYSGAQAISYWDGLGIVDNNGNVIQNPTDYNRHNYEAIGGWYYGDDNFSITLNSMLSEDQRIAMVYSTDEGQTWQVMPVGAEVPLGLNNEGLIEQGPDDPGDQEAPVNFSTYWDHFDGSFLECTAPADGTGSSMNTKGISFSIVGLTSDAYLCIAPKEASEWTSSLNIYYGEENSLEDDGQGIIAAVEDNKYWIPVSLAEVEANDNAIVVYLKMISSQAGTMNYDLQLYSEDKETPLASIDNKSLTFLGDQTYVFAPDPIVGEVNKPISFTWTPINVVPALSGKSATVLFRFQNMSSANTKLTYTVDGKEMEAVCEDVNGYLNATVEIASLESVEYKFTLETSVATQGTQLNSVYVSNIKVGENSIPLKVSVTRITVTAPVEAKPITWTFTPEDGLNFPAGGEGWFYLDATDIPTEYIGQAPTISLEIEGLLSDEVAIDYVKFGDDGSVTYVPLVTIPHPDFPTSNVCATQPATLEALGDGSYTFAMRYEGNMDKLPVSCYIRIESVSIGGMEIPSNFKEYNYTITAPDLPIEVSGKEVFYEESHKGKVVNVYSDGIYIVNEPNASIKELRIQPGGQVSLLQGLEVGKLSISHRIPANAWTTFGVPESTQNIILGDGTDDILTSGVMASRMGYKNANDQEWTTSFEADLPVATAILLAQSAETESYIGFHNRQFYNDNAEPLVLPSRLNTTSPGNKVDGNYFEFVANPLWENLTINGRAYVLNEATNSFELQESPTIPPFQAYMIASEAVMNSISSLRIGDIPTSNEDLAVTGFRVWSESGHVCFETTEAKDVAVYSMNGVQQCRFERSVGTHRQQLPQGIYIVVCGDTAYKVSVK